ncbi:MBOAT family O-acyltransferase [Butyricicoccus sp.]|uniref:MBOAT family O-acyltransferase n=1 Tax=Butyricicoccus sp. TaxID=2049021 RepID=UPI003F16D901
MNPNSMGYLSFLLIAAVIHAGLRPKWRNLWLTGISWLFYLVCAPKFFVLYLITSGINFVLAQVMEQKPERKKLLLVSGLLLDIGILFLFKYLNFFSSLVSQMLGLLGMTVPVLPAFVQPLGISFYTFTVTGYLVDVYQGKQSAEHSFWNFSLFVGFFPAVLSGPIARSTKLLPQVRQHAQHVLCGEEVKIGVTRICIGLAKKMLLADQLAIMVNNAYATPEQFTGLQLLTAVMAYSLQIYCDFSAYSDMAVGAGRLFGIELIENFDAPYLASSIKEFWRRWHISLTSWFRDYLYFPLGGSRRGKLRTYLNILIVFTVSGLWHGAAMQFLVWGLLNGLYQVIGMLFAPAGKRIRKVLHIPDTSRVLYVCKMAMTFLLATAAWVFFRAESVTQAVSMLICIVTTPGGLFPLTVLGLSKQQLIVTAIALLALFLWDLLGKRWALAQRLAKTVWLRYLVWTILILAVLCFGAYGTGYDAQEFVYFRF